jgi:hypothetical protein
MNEFERKHADWEERQINKAAEGKNSDERKIYAQCDWCWTRIYEGDAYYKIGDEVVCERCVEDARTVA